MKNKVVLTALNAKYIHSNLAVYSLKANAGEYRDEVELCEFTINHRKDEILCRLYEKKPAYLGFSCYLWNIEYVLDIAENLKKLLPGLTIFLGGPEVSYQPEKVLNKYEYIDLIMVGEGEKTFYEYLAWVENGAKDEEREQIDGLVYRCGREIKRTSPRQALDMDSLVFPYRDLKGMENRILYYESIRGCPFSCSYCLSSIEKTVRIKSLEKTCAEIDFFLQNRVPQVKFVDRTFNCNHEHAYRVWEYIGTHDNGITNFHFEIGGDLLREEDFALLRSFRPGLIQFEIGVQSVNPDTIKAIRRTMDLAHLRENIERIHKNRNIHQHLDLIAGLPYEDYASFRQSFNEVYAMKPDQFQLGFLKVLNGSYMDVVKEEYEIVFDSKPPYEVLATKWLPYEDVLRLKQVEEMVEVYYNSFQFAVSMAYLLRFFAAPFDMYREMGDFYKENHMLEIKHSRLQRYEILWNFVQERLTLTEEETEIFREVLTYDLYEREYVKNPPSFVAVRSEPVKKAIRSFFDRECKKRQVISGYDGLVTKQLYNLLYVDCFTVDMETLKETGAVKRTKPVYLMFDYRRRNPLDHAAAVVELGNLTE